MTTSPTMTEIDDDVMEKAREIGASQHVGSQWRHVRENYIAGLHDDDPVIVAASRALQAARNEERERCAKIAASATQYEEGRDIATAIREGK